ncbi:MAG TPA: hypothetical protein VMV44_16330 [Rectinemataceae bacterium]|nr:hypothetical protein [Rectinemataceae bacterium]
MKRSIFLVAGLALAGIGAYAGGSTCVACHSDDAKMKALYLPPPIVESEAEG